MANVSWKLEKSQYQRDDLRMEIDQLRLARRPVPADLVNRARLAEARYLVNFAKEVGPGLSQHGQQLLAESLERTIAKGEGKSARGGRAEYVTMRGEVNITHRGSRSLNG